MNATEKIEMVGELLMIVGRDERREFGEIREIVLKLEELHSSLISQVEAEKLKEPLFSCQDVSQIVTDICNNRKVNAIKLIRDKTGVGLKMAKDQVDMMWKEIRGLIEEETRKVTGENE